MTERWTKRQKKGKKRKIKKRRNKQGKTSSWEQERHKQHKDGPPLPQILMIQLKHFKAPTLYQCHFIKEMVLPHSCLRHPTSHQLIHPHQPNTQHPLNAPHLLNIHHPRALNRQHLLNTQHLAQCTTPAQCITPTQRTTPTQCTAPALDQRTDKSPAGRKQATTPQTLSVQSKHASDPRRGIHFQSVVDSSEDEVSEESDEDCSSVADEGGSSGSCCKEQKIENEALRKRLEKVHRRLIISCNSSFVDRVAKCESNWNFIVLLCTIKEDFYCKLCICIFTI